MAPSASREVALGQAGEGRAEVPGNAPMLQSVGGQGAREEETEEAQAVRAACGKEVL